MRVAIMIEVTSRRMECTLLTSNYSQMPATALQWWPRQRSYISPDVVGRQQLHLPRCSWTAAPSIKQQKPSLSCRPQTSRLPSKWSLDRNLIHFSWQAHLSLIDGGEGMLQPLQLRCIHAQLSQQWDLATKSRMSTKMLQTTNRKLPTAMLTYKRNEIYESSYYDRSD